MWPQSGKPVQSNGDVIPGGTLIEGAVKAAGYEIPKFSCKHPK